MTRVRRVLVLTVALVVVASLISAAAAQAPEGRRQGRAGLNRGSLLGLLRIEQVQKDLKLDDETVAKVKELQEKLGAEMREKAAAAREIEDRAQRREKMTEVRGESDRKAREQLREILSKEQMMRLYQIRMQLRSVAESLTNKYVAGKLKLTDEQKEKLAQIQKDARAKRTELMSGLRDAGDEQRREAMTKVRQLRTETDEKALGILTDEQKEAFEKMKGEKIELPSRRRRQ